MKRIYIRPTKEAGRGETKSKRTLNRSGKVTVYTTQDFAYADEWLYPRADIQVLTQEQLRELLQ